MHAKCEADKMSSSLYIFRVHQLLSNEEWASGATANTVGLQLKKANSVFCHESNVYPKKHKQWYSHSLLISINSNLHINKGKLKSRCILVNVFHLFLLATQTIHTWLVKLETETRIILALKSLLSRLQILHIHKQNRFLELTSRLTDRQRLPHFLER